MAVRKRSWESGGTRKQSWVVDFRDAAGRRRLKTFQNKREADRFEAAARAIGAGAIPEPLTRGYRPIEFSFGLADNGWKKAAARENIVKSFRAAHPGFNPTTDNVIVHVSAEMPPSHVVADVDNLLKPVLDALTGVVWMDDTQVCEVLARRFPSSRRRLTIKIWQAPGRTLVSHLNALAQAGLTS